MTAPTVGDLLSISGYNADGSDFAGFAAGKHGVGSPEGAVAAPVGTLYTDTSATDGRGHWLKVKGGSGDTGWRRVKDSIDAGAFDIDPTGGVDSSAGLTLADQAAVSAGVALYVPPGIYRLETAGQLTLNSLLKLPRGVLFRTAPGTELFISSAFRCGGYQVFDPLLGGTFALAKVDVVDVRWFGAKGDSLLDGSGADDTLAWQAAIDASPEKARIRLPASFCSKTTAPLLVYVRQELVFEMSGRGSYFGSARSGIDYRGADNTPAVRIYNSFGIQWNGINIFINRDGKTAQGAIDVDKFSDGTMIDGRTISGGTTSDCAFRQFAVNSTGNSDSAYGIRMAYTSAANVENICVQHLGATFNQNLNDQTNINRAAALQIGGGGGGANCKNMNFFRIVTQGCRSVVSAAGGASWSLEEGESQRSTIDFDSLSAVCKIARFRSENGQQFFVGGGQPTLIANEIAYGGWTVSKPLVHIAGTSTLTMIGNAFDNDGLEAAGPVSVDAVQTDATRFIGIGNHYRDGIRPDFSKFGSGAIDILSTDHLIAEIAESNQFNDVGPVIRFRDGTVLANLVSRDFGRGTLGWALDAQPGNRDATGLSDSSQYGEGAFVYKGADGKWKALATNEFKYLQFDQPGGGYVLPLSGNNQARIYFRDSTRRLMLSEDARAEVALVPLHGTASLAAASSVAVSFGAVTLPNLPVNITLTPKGDIGTGVRYWLSNITNTGFTLNASSAATCDFFWSAR